MSWIGDDRLASLRNRLRERSVVEDHGFESACHIWQGATTAHGYGNVSYKDGDRMRTVSAHRLSHAREHDHQDQRPVGTASEEREGGGMSATVERLWRAHGLDCAVMWVNGTHRCGYVRVDSTHPWHGVDYGEPAPGLPPSPEAVDGRDFHEDVGIVAAFAYALSSEEKRVESRRTPQLRVAVHGGLTFSGELVGEDVPEGWWFGFDCHHLDDTPTRWTEERVAQECERLAEQLSNIGVAA